MGAVKDYKKYTQLSRVFNGFYGSSGPGEARVSTQSVKFKPLDEDLIKATYQTLVSVGSPHMQEQLQHVFNKEGLSMIEGSLKRAKEQWEKEFPDDKAPTFEINLNSANESLEFVHYSAYSPVKRAIFRLTLLITVS